ncbi:MAG: PilZ domain-containing protein [Burkholderiales bacterium]|nr:PilZ domain-containing protein [Burkholderiales bacterium]
MFEEHRTDPREPLALPLTLGDGSAAVTRDISASGLYFEIKGSYSMTGPVLFEMQLAELGMKFSAEGDIVRVERRDDATGFAVKLRQPRLEPILVAPF